MPAGRPTVVTEEVKKVLIECFTYAATDGEACETAGISPTALYEYCRKNPEFAQQKERLKRMPNYTAKKVVVDKINNGDEKQANWWLERKAKDDGFSSRQEVTGKNGKDLEVQPVLVKFMDEQQTEDNRDTEGV